jgi:hypothetical protein
MSHVHESRQREEKDMLTNAKISDGRDVILDIEPMDEHQQKMLCTAIADFLIRSGQARDDVAMNVPTLLQFLSEAGDMAQEQAKPIDPEDVTIFSAATEFRGEGDHFVSTPDEFLIKRTIDGTFDESDSAIDEVHRAVADDETLAESIATLLNRAYWLGQGRCAPFHVTPRS